MSLHVLQPGLLSLLQDRGRFGQHRIGLTNGGPLDPGAYDSCNRLLQNPDNSTVIEASFGGLQLEAHADTFICVTGADMPLLINDQECALWQVHSIKAGDRITLEYARSGCRSYLGVADGFQVPATFGSTATVVRENLGGLNGEKLGAGDVLACHTVTTRPLLFLPLAAQPQYTDTLTVRVIPGYQQAHFNRLQQRRFFSHSYSVSGRSLLNVAFRAYSQKVFVAALFKSRRTDSLLSCSATDRLLVGTRKSDRHCHSTVPNWHR